jgi:hypothetical protein
VVTLHRAVAVARVQGPAVVLGQAIALARTPAEAAHIRMCLDRLVE